MTILCHNLKMYSAEELAARVGITPRMVRYRARIGLLRTAHRRHRPFTHHDESALILIRQVESEYNASPDEIAFALRAMTTRRLAEQIRHIGEMYGRVDPLAALDFEQEKALQLLRTQRVSTSGDERSLRA